MGSTTKGTLMTALILIAIDLVAMAALVFGLYFPRHRRADLVAAFLRPNLPAFSSRSSAYPFLMPPGSRA